MGIFAFAGVILSNPGGTNTQTGIAFHPGSDSFFMVDVTAETLYQLDSSFAVIRSFPLISPVAGVIGGITCADGRLWMNDFGTWRPPTSMDLPSGPSI